MGNKRLEFNYRHFKLIFKGKDINVISDGEG